MKKFVPIAILFVTLLSGCESAPDIKSTLGLKKPAPDEFMVISNPPLTTPPDFNLTMPDSEPARYNAEIIEAPQALDKSDKEFLGMLGHSSDTTVKREIDSTYHKEKKTKKEKGTIRKTFDKVAGGKKDPVIDPVAEKARIKENLDAGKPVNEGDVKVEQKSTLDNILGN
ncbi:MAG: DUF3035 domain-containing protein [Rickettsiales bacterium]